MRVLGIESSCDETAIAIVEKNQGRFSVVKNIVASQIALHAKYGGVVPEIAARSHVDVIFPLLEEAGIPHDGKGIDAIAVTAGPGLVPALRIGVELAKTLAWCWKKPLVAVNHLEGHISSVWLDDSPATPSHSPVAFPSLALLVSGGHTELILMHEHGKYEMIGMTRDDAVGEAFDKVAKLLGLPYPGGPSVSQEAEKGNPEAMAFPRPMLESPNFDFSFSGLKTAVAVYRFEHPTSSVSDICASFQRAVVDVLTLKTLAAIERYAPKSVLLSGGVSANTLLRLSLRDAVANAFPDVSFHVPPREYTTDNAAMIAVAGIFRAEKKDFTDPTRLVADPNLVL